MIRKIHKIQVLSYGAIAQLVEHFVRNEGVAGSIPVSSTLFQF
jgi:hypothetical protein